MDRIIAAEPSYHMMDLFNDYFSDDEEIPESFDEPLYGGRQMAIDASIEFIKNNSN